MSARRPAADFDPKKPETWPITLTPHHMGLIYERTAGGIRKAAQKRQFHPAPFKARPWLWRKTDVLRDVLGPRGADVLRMVS